MAFRGRRSIGYCTSITSAEYGARRAQARQALHSEVVREFQAESEVRRIVSQANGQVGHYGQVIGRRYGHADIEVTGIGITGGDRLPVSPILLEFALFLNQVGDGKRHTHFFVEGKSHPCANLETVTQFDLAGLLQVLRGTDVVK